MAVYHIRPWPTGLETGYLFYRVDRAALAAPG